MDRPYIGLGSNLGDRLHHLEHAIALLGEGVRVTAVSPVYETEPVGYSAQGWFLNCVAELATPLPPRALLGLLQRIERRMGKATPFPDGPRVIDLDLLLYDEDIVDEPGLHVPHPRMHERRFVLAPLSDLAPEAVHPVLGERVADILARLPAAEHVRPFDAAPRPGFATEAHLR